MYSFVSDLKNGTKSAKKKNRNLVLLSKMTANSGKILQHTLTHQTFPDIVMLCFKVELTYYVTGLNFGLLILILSTMMI